MRTILLSFKASVYEKLKNGQKIYEHRRVFPNEDIKAYLYISSPIKAVGVIIYLTNRRDLLEFKNNLGDEQYELVSLIEQKLQEHRYVMDISSFQKTCLIKLNELCKELSSFTVPQMYYYIDGTPRLDYLERNLYYDGKKVVNRFEDKSDVDALLS